MPILSLNRNAKIAVEKHNFEIDPQCVNSEEGQRKYFSIAITEAGRREARRIGASPDEEGDFASRDKARNFNPRDEERNFNPRDEEYNFTPRESEIADLVLQGLGNDRIADELCLSVSTVKFHIGKIYEKLDVKNRTSAITKLSQ
jgi:DNA-binding NarL/FixJ family response regulator